MSGQGPESPGLTPGQDSDYSRARKTHSRCEWRRPGYRCGKDSLSGPLGEGPAR